MGYEDRQTSGRDDMSCCYVSALLLLTLQILMAQYAEATSGQHYLLLECHS